MQHLFLLAKLSTMLYFEDCMKKLKALSCFFMKASNTDCCSHFFHVIFFYKVGFLNDGLRIALLVCESVVASRKSEDEHYYSSSCCL